MAEDEYQRREELGKATYVVDQAPLCTVKQVTDTLTLLRQQTDDVPRQHYQEPTS